MFAGALCDSSQVVGTCFAPCVSEDPLLWGLRIGVFVPFTVGSVAVTHALCNSSQVVGTYFAQCVSDGPVLCVTAVR